jgi:DNA-binding LacI/PurR family transcriptional regulator
MIVGSYHLPDWEESVRGFHSRLDSLFQVTPPTALIIEEAPLFTAVQQFLSQRKLRVPQDVSLVCTDADVSFEWCRPTISHIRWDSRPIVRRIVRWAANVSTGKKDLHQSLTQAEFVQGGTIGPVRDESVQNS